MGEWVVGVGSSADGIRGRMVFAMRVEGAMTFDEYWEDERFQMKKPSFSGSLKQAQGDNVYHGRHGEWVPERSRHTHWDPEMTAKHTRRDTCRNRVLVSRHFVYYGAEAIELPDGVRRQAWIQDLLGRVRNTEWWIPTREVFR